MQADQYKIAFASLRGMTRELAAVILARTGSEEAFFTTPESTLGAMFGRRNRLFDTAYRNETLEKARRELDFINTHSIRVSYYTDSDYPARLRECDDAPLALYSIGNCDLNSTHIVSIVGTRHATPYGIDFVMNLVKELREKLDSLVIVSGLAYGIDVAAHRASLHHSVPTAAVLAHGLNMVYPAPHRSTAAEMVKSGGMLISDYMSQDRLHRGNFLARNRIVAGLCDCLVVAESAAKGGALVTAGIAAGYNRDVVALPGRRGDKYSAGCNRLIASNTAALVQSADDIISLMRWTPRITEGSQGELPLELSDEEQKVIDCLTRLDEANVNRLCVTLDMPMHRLMPLLVDMEFKGLLVAYPGGKYRIS